MRERLVLRYYNMRAGAAYVRGLVSCKPSKNFISSQKVNIQYQCYNHAYAHSR